MENRIVVKFGGGLGNQLFDYAFYEWIKKEFPGKRVLADLSNFRVDMPHNGLGIWQVFPKVNLNKARLRDLLELTGEIPVFYGGPFKHKIDFMRQVANKHIFMRKDSIFKYENDWISPEKARNIINDGNCYLDSYWQDSGFFLEVNSLVRNTLIFGISNVVPYENEMRKKNAVSLHVRRGDYVGSVFEKEVNETYYRKAVEYINNKVSNPHYYIFSDDKNYVREVFNWIDNKTIVDGFDNKKSYIDMYLMSLTPNSIIANSTFSQWAAYLNQNNDPVVVYPNVEYMSHKKLDGWIGL